MAMTKKDYVLIAAAINNALCKDGDVVSGLADALASQNPRFNKTTFMEACLPHYMRIHDNSAKGYVVPKHFTDVKVGDKIRVKQSSGDYEIFEVLTVEQENYWELDDFPEYQDDPARSMPFRIETGAWVYWEDVEHA